MVEGEEQKMFLWILAIAVVVALTGAGVMFMGRLHGSRARGRCLSGLGVVAGILYTAIALYPWRGYDRESGLFVLAALPIAFIAQTVGAIMCLRVMVMDPEAREPWDWVCVTGNLILLLGSLAVLLIVGDGGYLLATVPGACVVVFVMFWIHYWLQRDEQRA